MELADEAGLVKSLICGAIPLRCYIAVINAGGDISCRKLEELIPMIKYDDHRWMLFINKTDEVGYDTNLIELFIYNLDEAVSDNGLNKGFECPVLSGSVNDYMRNRKADSSAAQLLNDCFAAFPNDDESVEEEFIMPVETVSRSGDNKWILSGTVGSGNLMLHENVYLSGAGNVVTLWPNEWKCSEWRWI